MVGIPGIEPAARKADLPGMIRRVALRSVSSSCNPCGRLTRGTSTAAGTGRLRGRARRKPSLKPCAAGGRGRARRCASQARWDSGGRSKAGGEGASASGWRPGRNVRRACADAGSDPAQRHRADGRGSGDPVPNSAATMRPALTPSRRGHACDAASVSGRLPRPRAELRARASNSVGAAEGRLGERAAARRASCSGRATPAARHSRRSPPVSPATCRRRSAQRRSPALRAAPM